MPSNLYNKGLQKLLNDTINPLNDVIRVLVVSPAYTYDKNHEFVADLAAAEVSNKTGAGYERKTLANKEYALDNENNRVFFTADNPLYEKIETEEELAQAILYKVGTSDADSPLIAAINFANLVTNGSDVELIINTGGLYRINNLIGA